MLAVKGEYLEPPGLDDDEEKMQRLQCKASWLLFKKKAKPAKAPTTVTTDSAHKVVFFSNQSALKMSSQVSPLPHRSRTPSHTDCRCEWYRGIGSFVGDGAADQSAAVAVLQRLHTNYPVGAEPVDVLQLAGRNFVIARRKANAHETLLPPCVSKQSHASERAEQPFATQMKVSFLRQTEQATE